MSKFRITCLVICGIALAVFSNAALAAQKVVVISGVSEANANKIGYPLIYGGINEIFKEAGIVPEYQWAELNALTDAAAKTAAGETAIAKQELSTPML